ncbi:hypothetical protein CYY_003035 [Polysphondylium violaceum]|uniref:POT1A/B-like OB fold domain-containing protein n=1 Tax=Polysphondylium violaceum TaxID=133409 RepID=A0A8J4V6B2_9MYCE|nr:hypothetical protein CYY_003035 [Polysphondylium violaceum]
MSKLTDYKYRKLADLDTSILNDFYCFCINKSDVRKKSSGTFIAMLVADGPSKEKSAIKITLFFESSDFIEAIQFGTILRFQNMKTSHKEGGIMGIGELERGKYNFHCLVINQETGERLSKTPNYSWTKKDAEIVEEMKALWTEGGVKEFWSTPSNNNPRIGATPDPNRPIPIKTTFVKIGDINKSMNFVSILVRLLDKSSNVGPTGKRATLKLWDGTGEGYTHGFDGTTSSSTLGSFIYANTWDQDLINLFDEMNIDAWFAATGVKVNSFREVLELKFFKTTKVIPLSDEDPLVLSALRNYKIRVEGDATNPFTDKSNNNNNNINNNSTITKDDEQVVESWELPDNRLTETAYPHIPTIKIIDILNSDKVPMKFKIAVRLVNHIPSVIQQFTRIRCRSCKHISTHITSNFTFCLNCQSDETEYVFYFKTILRDQTGQIPVIFYEHTNAFFNLIPDDLFRNKEKLAHIENKIKLLKKPDMLFECCIMSYYQADKERTPENVLYQIFDTKLIV